MTVLKFEKILSEFDDLPDINLNQSFLELCRYPGSRFEEVCSRILVYYLDPKANHGLGSLVLDCLLEILNNKGIKAEYSLPLYLELEDPTPNGRIDIVIRSKDMVIAIENKIDASINNPLAEYRNKIRDEKKKYCVGVVLTLKPIDKSYIKKFGFIHLFHRELNSKILNALRRIDSKEKNQRINFLEDYILTLNNMDKYEFPGMEKELVDFFYNRNEKVQEMVEAYNAFKKSISEIHKDKYQSLIDLLKKQKKGDWWNWHNEGIGIKLTKDGHEIGIEAQYQILNRNPLGVFHIYLTTWGSGNTGNSFHYFQKSIENEFDLNLDATTHFKNERLKYPIKELENPDLNEVETELIGLYEKLLIIVS